MEKEFDIEIITEEENEEQSIQLPLNFLSFGEIENDDVKVYIKQDVYKALEKYASSDTTKELGTILIGNYCEELGKKHVIISDYIEAKYTDASASTLTFTHETWDYVHKEHDKNFSDKKIIGWQHTHPNYGIFLSNYDLFIQENFFNLPFQVAYVIDPIQNIRGFFQWKNDKIEKLRGYYIYDEVGKPIKIEQKKVDKPSYAAPKKTPFVLAVIFCILAFGLGILSIILNNKYEEQLKINKADEEIITEQNEIIDTQEQNITDLQTQLVSGITGQSDIKTVEDLIAKIKSGAIKVSDSEAVIAELQSLIDHYSADSKDPVIRFVSYTVKEGDSLSTICEDHNIDYYASEGVILSINGIENSNSIYVGQTIVLPLA